MSEHETKTSEEDDDTGQTGDTCQTARRRSDVVARFWCWWHSNRWPSTGEAGQSTVEYALVLLGAAAVALALVAWVTRSDAVQRLFDAVVSRILSQAG